MYQDGSPLHNYSSLSGRLPDRLPCRLLIDPSGASPTVQRATAQRRPSACQSRRGEGSACSRSVRSPAHEGADGPRHQVRVVATVAAFTPPTAAGGGAGAASCSWRKAGRSAAPGAVRAASRSRSAGRTDLAYVSYHDFLTLGRRDVLHHHVMLCSRHHVMKPILSCGACMESRSATWA